MPQVKGSQTRARLCESNQWIPSYLHSKFGYDFKNYCAKFYSSGVSAGKRDQINKKIFFKVINILDQMIKSTSILLRNFFLKKISIWFLFPALTPSVNIC